VVTASPTRFLDSLIEDSNVEEEVIIPTSCCTPRDIEETRVEDVIILVYSLICLEREDCKVDEVEIKPKRAQVRFNRA